MMKKSLILLIILLSGCSGAQNVSWASDAGPIWTFATMGKITALPLITDLDGNSRQEVLLASNDGTLYVLGPDGRELWSFDAASPLEDAPLAADVNGDRRQEIFFGTTNGTFYALSADGRKLWDFAAGGPITSAPVLFTQKMDPDYFRQTEIIFGSWDGTLYALSVDGAQAWNYTAPGQIKHSPVIADADADGRPEVVFSAGGSVYGVDRPEAEAWVYSAGSEASSSPIVRDINRDGRYDMLTATGSGQVRAMVYRTVRKERKIDCSWGSCHTINITESEIFRRWDYNASGEIESPIAASDIDGDRRAEVFFGVSDAKPYVIDRALQVLNASGEPAWRYTVSGRIISKPLAFDLDADGKEEIIFGTDDGTFYALNASGYAIWRLQLDRPVRGGAAAADLDRDGISEILLSSGNTLRAYGSIRDNDSDGVIDFAEHLSGTDPNDNDSDGDGLIDSEDSAPLDNRYKHMDSDGDGLSDYEEMRKGTDPQDPDSDRDGLSDSKDPEPLKNRFMYADSDKDGLSDYDETRLGTDPKNRDSDGDGLIDSVDPDPLNNRYKALDSDWDGLSDWDEKQIGTDPYKADSDGDGLIDSADPHPLENEEMYTFYNSRANATASGSSESRVPVAAFSVFMLGLLAVFRETGRKQDRRKKASISAGPRESAWMRAAVLGEELAEYEAILRARREHILRMQR